MTSTVDSPVADRRTRVRRQHLTELTSCPGHETLRILSTKWLTLVAEVLLEGRHGHAAIARRVPGATQKMLTQTLRQMERDGLVDRTVTPTTPPSVDYELTDLGRSLAELQRSILTWGRANITEIQQARSAYDTRPSPSIERDAR
jgi:DNA-binding HxlR family transcriptional regulator